MKSPEKVLLFLEELQNFSDEEISEAIPLPVPAYALRGGLAAVAGQVPDDPDDLDGMLNTLGNFILSKRSDPDEPAPEA